MKQIGSELEQAMAQFKNILIIMALCALTATVAQESQGGPHTTQGGLPTSQGGPHQNQGRSRRQAQDVDYEASVLYPTESNANWTTCDFTVIPKISCHDCHTKMICKQIGGLLKGCNNPFRPYCNNGICSAVPSAECA